VANLAQVVTARKDTRTSKRLSDELSRLVPGGVNSPFRTFDEVGGHTIFFQKAFGSRIYDVDGNEYLDYLGAWGPAILGYAHPEIVAACQRVLKDGLVFGAPCELELEFARAITNVIPSLEQVRFVNSGTEAVMSAVRLARGVTGRDKVIMFEGGYHGHSDATLASSKHASSKGVPPGTSADTILVEYNNLEALALELQTSGKQVACVLVEPVAGSMNVVVPDRSFLEGLRALCTKYGALLIFDEVLTGFRVHLGGAQGYFDVHPDLSCFGKALAGGMPVGAYGGSIAIMSELQPIGSVYQAGTFSGNPVTMAGGIETIKLLSNPALFETLNSLSAKFVNGLTDIAKKHGYPVQFPHLNAMFGISFAAEPVKNYNDSLKIDSKAYAKFFHFLLKEGIYLPPSSVDAACISAAHSLEEIEFTLSICAAAFAEIW
jgi:glutamate-1-semialdehyde 2,1-aminomutase